MKSILKLIIFISFFSGSVTAKTPDPLQPILDRLDSIEDRLAKIEKKNLNIQNTNIQKSRASLPTTKSVVVKNKAKPTNFKQGMIIDLKPTRNIKEWKLAPLDSIDAFTWDGKGKITTKLLTKKNIKATNSFGYEAKGYLKIENPGLYNIKVTQQIGESDARFNSLNIMGWLEDQLFINQQANSTIHTEGKLVGVGALKLETGIYQLRLWIASTNSNYNSNQIGEVSIEIKEPNEIKYTNIQNTVYYKTK